MIKEEQKKIEEKAVCFWGPTSQRIKAIEEMSELIKELCKWEFHKTEETQAHITEEMADVEIMLEQLKLIFQNTQKIEEWKDKKITRLAEKLDTELQERDKMITEELQRWRKEVLGQND